MSKTKSKPRVSVVKETTTGRNEKFRDNATGDVMTRTQFADHIEQGRYPEYHVRNVNGKRTPASNPDGKTKNNLG